MRTDGGRLPPAWLPAWKGDRIKALAFGRGCHRGGSFREASLLTRSWHLGLLAPVDLAFLRSLPTIDWFEWVHRVVHDHLVHVNVAFDDDAVEWRAQAHPAPGVLGLLVGVNLGFGGLLLAFYPQALGCLDPRVFVGTDLLGLGIKRSTSSQRTRAPR
jgi:hypothetical protein